MSKLVQIPKSTQNSGAGKKKYSSEKKNTPFSLTHSILSENDTKVIFSRNKKKYGTFARANQKLSRRKKRGNYCYINGCIQASCVRHNTNERDFKILNYKFFFSVYVTRSMANA